MTLPFRGPSRLKRPKQSSESVKPLPSCPSWLLLAQAGSAMPKKTHHELLPLISAVKSPQAIMGTLVKDWLASRLDSSLDLPAAQLRRQIYHVTVMPCYDKKLEASRQDFTDEDGVRDVDCVLTTGRSTQDAFRCKCGSGPQKPISQHARTIQSPFSRIYWHILDHLLARICIAIIAGIVQDVSSFERGEITVWPQRMFEVAITLITL